jgi:hypothetical protein
LLGYSKLLVQTKRIRSEMNNTCAFSTYPVELMRERQKKRRRR